MSGLLQEEIAELPKEEVPPTYVVEVAKSGRAECKKCDCKIENKNIRVGVIVDGEWGLHTRWQHLDCTVFHKGILSVEELDGYGELDAKSKTAIQERFAESAGEVDEDALPLDPDELVRKAWEQPLEPSTNLLMPLLPYQKEGLGWMTHQEQNDTHGGILADEMGMGKTIQAISLMLQNRPDMSDFAQLREWAASDARHTAAPLSASSTSSSSSSTPPAEMVRCGTLVVLPTVAIRQWQTEIARFTKEGSLTVKVYHGSDRNTTALDLTKTDVVLTSYKILEIEYRKATAGTKVTCRLCSKKFYPDKLRIHRKYFCGESAQRTEAQALTQKKKARTSSQDPSTETKGKGRPGSGTAFKRPALSSTTTTATAKGKRRPSLSTSEVENGEEEEEEEEEVITKPAAARGRAKAPASAAKTAVGKAKGNAKGTTTPAKKGGKKSSAVVESDSSPHSSNEEEDEVEVEVEKPRAKRGRGGAAGSAAVGKGNISKKTAVSTRKEIDTEIKTEVKIEIKEEPLYFDDVPYEPIPVVGKGAGGAKKQAPAAPAPTGRGRRAASPGVTLKRSGHTPAADINDDTSGSEGVEAMDVDGESSGSDIDAPPVTRRGASTTASASTAKRGRFSAATPPASGVKAALKRRSGTPTIPATASASARTSAHSIPTPVRSSSRAAAQGKKKYADNSDGDADSADEYGDLDSEFEQDEDEEEQDRKEGEEDSGDSGSDLADTEEEEDEEEERAGRGARGKSGGRGGRTVGSKKLVTPSKAPTKKASSVSPRGPTKATPNRAAVKGLAKGKGKVGVGGKRGKAAVAAEEEEEGDGDDVAWETGSESSSSSDDDSDDASDEDEEEDEEEEDGKNNKRKRGASAGKRGAGKAGGGGGGESDSEVERDIQEALLEAAKALRRSKTAAAVSVLHTVSWFRIILDEAHLIKDRSTSTAKSVFNLTSLNKWCLTGTPLQNRVGELYSLIRFLRIDPHAFYYCRSKGCCCKSLHYRFTKSYCDECNHSVIQHYCHFNKHILNPIKRSGYVADGRRAMLKLKQQVLDEILLRRTKTTRFEDIQLPPRIVTVRSERLDVKEEDFYSALYTQSQAQFNTYLQSGTVLNNYAHIFDILIRLRQAVDHPYLVIYSDAQTAKRDDSDNYLNLTNGDDGLVKIKAEPGTVNNCCDLCHEPAEDPVRSASCEHSFCRGCITDYIGSVSTGAGSGGLRCPDCDQALTIQLAPVLSPNSNGNVGHGNGKTAGSTPSRRGSAGRVSTSGSAQDLQQTQDSASVWDAAKGLSRKSILDKVDLNLFQSSTKIEALMEELYKMQSQDLGAKAIVFSQFVNMLDIISYRLQRGGLQCVKLSGSMGLEQRDKCITAFKTDPNIKVMLISLKAGGVALNLTVASRIFLMDPWWNPAAEMQAIDRTHRIGQHRPIYATRFIIENTIEERILRLQEKKKLVFDGTVGGDSGSMSKLTVDDMRFLFN